MPSLRFFSPLAAHLRGLYEVVSAWDRLKTLLLSVALVSISFADVLFLGATLSQADTYNIQYPNYLYPVAGPNSDGPLTYRERPTTTLYPERENRAVIDGINDAGGSVWQSEPAALFMRYAINSGESPYWNPYSSAGALGPETLVDIKFSPFSVLFALTGGGTLAFNLLLLLFYAQAVYFLGRFCIEHLRLTHWSALAAGIVYLLCGYSVANLASNVSQVYLFFPLFLYCAGLLARRVSVTNVVLVTLASALIWSISFLPTTVLALTSLYAIAAAITTAACLAAAGPRVTRHVFAPLAWRLALLAGVGLISFLMLAFMYLPIIESFAVVDALSMYKERVFYPVTLTNLYSVFSPKHLWESYNAIDPDLWNPSLNESTYIGNGAFHVGIVPAIIAFSALRVFRRPWRIELVAVFALLGVAGGRIFAVPGVSDLVQRIPVFGSIGTQYWWTVIAITLPLLVAWGMHALINHERWRWVTWAGALVVAFAFLYSFSMHGWPDRPWGSRYVSTLQSVFYVVAGMVFLGGVLVAAAYTSTSTRLWPKMAIVVLIFIELTFYMNHMRYQRLEFITEPPDYVTFLKDRIGNNRIMNVGAWGVPPEYGAAFQLQQLGSMNMNILPRYLEFFQRAFVPDPADRWGLFATMHHLRDQVPAYDEELLDALAVEFVIVPKTHELQREFFFGHAYEIVYQNPSFDILQNPDPYPRLFLVAGLSRQDFDPTVSPLPTRRLAYTDDEELIEQARALGVPVNSPGLAGADSTTGPGAAVLVDYGHSKVVAEVQANEPSVLILMDNWHPNWRVFVDGEEAYLGRVNHAFRGVVLPPGAHRVVYSYSPATLSAGLGVSGAMALLLLFLLFFHRRLDVALRVRTSCCPSHAEPPDGRTRLSAL